MMIYAQSLILVSLGHLAAAQSEKSYLRRRTNAVEAKVESPRVSPLTVDNMLLTLSTDEELSSTGIALSESAISGSDSISVQFQVLPSNLVDAEVDLNLTRVDDWSVGIFMHMSDPQGGALPPIVSLKPNIENKDAGRDMVFNYEGDVTFSSDAIRLMGGSDPIWPLDTVEYGVAFDVWLLDQDGAAIIGPEWFTLEPPEIEENEFVAADTPLHALDIHGHADDKQEFLSEDEEESTPLGAPFVLTTDKGSYTSDEKIQVTYTIGELSTTSTDTDQLILFDPPALDEMDSVEDMFSVSQQHNDIFEIYDDENMFDADFAPDVNGNDTPQYSIGIWMKMARPQAGRLAPIISVPVKMNEGTVEFDSSDLDTLEYGTGFDIWIVDEDGNGIYGPVFFSIPDPNEEAPIVIDYSIISS